MTQIKTLSGLAKHFETASDEIKGYFYKLPELIGDVSNLEIAVTYMFLKTEQAHTRSLYGGVIRLHRGHAEITRTIVQDQHLTRKKYRELYENVFGKAFSKEIAKVIEPAEETRDLIVHGKTVKEPEMRDAVAKVLDYAVALNSEISKIAGFTPFGSMQGFNGRANPLEQKTTRWLLGGLGFAVS